MVSKYWKVERFRHWNCSTDGSYWWDDVKVKPFRVINIPLLIKITSFTSLDRSVWIADHGDSKSLKQQQLFLKPVLTGFQVDCWDEPWENNSWKDTLKILHVTIKLFLLLNNCKTWGLRTSLKYIFKPKNGKSINVWKLNLGKLQLISYAVNR